MDEQKIRDIMGENFNEHDYQLILNMKKNRFHTFPFYILISLMLVGGVLLSLYFPLGQVTYLTISFIISVSIFRYIILISLDSLDYDYNWKVGK